MNKKLVGPKCPLGLSGELNMSDSPQMGHIRPREILPPACGGTQNDTRGSIVSR
ncbi:MAG: hypothetical protein ABII96_07210 [Candidatus Zixiibacteriota bacterium]